MSSHPMTAERRFEAGYGRRLLWGLAAAALIHALLLLFVPAPQFQPYRLTEKTIIQVLDVPPAVTVTEPPEELTKPPAVTAIEPSADPAADETTSSNALVPDEPFVRPVHEARPDFVVVFDEPPEVIERVRPVYPELARLAELEGVVLLKVGIDEQGRVREAIVLESVPGLDEAALEAVRRWRFRPARQRDVPVPVWYYVPIRFSLKD